MDWSDCPVFGPDGIFKLGHVLNSIYVAVALLIWHRYFRKPVDWKQDFLDYYDDSVDFRTKSWRKAHAINEARKNRRLTEFPPFYPNGWYNVMDSFELKKNVAKEVHILGQNLVIWRGQSGTAYMSDAYCPHLSAHLGVGGKVNGECIRCPFHEWEYDGSCDGQLAKIPYSKTILKGVKLQMKRILEKDGVIYMWHHEENQEPTWTPEMPKEFHSRKMHLRGKFEIKTTSHAQDLVENIMDAQHLIYVHRLPLKSEATWSRVKGEGNEHLSRFYLNPHLEFCGFKFHAKLDGLIQGPGLFMGVFSSFVGTYCQTVAVNPIDPLVTTVTMRIYSSHSFYNPIDLVVLNVEYYLGQQDIPILNRKGYCKSPALPKEDESIKAGRNWYNQFYSKKESSKAIKSDESDTKQSDCKHVQSEANGLVNH